MSGKALCLCMGLCMNLHNKCLVGTDHMFRTKYFRPTLSHCFQGIHSLLNIW